jgi:hypothetical protein
MPSAYVPAALQHCYDTVKAAIPSAQLGGIYANKPGYHNARAQLPSSDYSVQKSYDKQGDAWAASGLDITLQPGDMKRLTQRLIDATLANPQDPRVRALREFFGTVDGVNVTGLDVPGRYWVTSDSSHLWHVHLSGKRSYTGDEQAWADVASVLLATDQPTPPAPGGDDVPSYVNLGKTKAPQQVAAGKWAWVQFDAKWSDAGKVVGSGLAGIHIGGKLAISTVLATVTATDGKGTIYSKLQYMKSDGSAVQSESTPMECVATSGGTYILDTRTIQCPANTYARVALQGSNGLEISRVAWSMFYW